MITKDQIDAMISKFVSIHNSDLCARQIAIMLTIFSQENSGLRCAEVARTLSERSNRESSRQIVHWSLERLRSKGFVELCGRLYKLTDAGLESVKKIFS